MFWISIYEHLTWNFLSAEIHHLQSGSEKKERQLRNHVRSEVEEVLKIEEDLTYKI